MSLIHLVIFFTLLLSRLCFAHSSLTLTSSAFEPNQWIPSQYTCTGANINPPLTITNIPASTKSFVLMVYDTDTSSKNFVHWAVYSIDPKTRTIPANSIPGRELINGFNEYHYHGPCVPNGDTHHYVFDLYAVDNQFSMNENGSPQGLLQQIQGHVLDKAQLIGLYKKS